MALFISRNKASIFNLHFLRLFSVSKAPAYNRISLSIASVKKNVIKKSSLSGMKLRFFFFFFI